jgi:hypothetical protein
MTISNKNKYASYGKQFTRKSHITHTGNNLTVAIDISTTGDRPFFNDITEIRLLPLQDDYTPSPVFQPFAINMRPKRMYNLSEKKLRNLTFIKWLKEIPYTCHDAAGIFEDWFASLELTSYGKLIPLCYEWGVIKYFLQDWFYWDDKGNPYINDFFHRELCKEIKPVAVYLNDLARRNVQDGVFGGMSLTSIMSSLDLIRENPVNTYAKCENLAKTYKKLTDLKLHVDQVYIE